MTEMWQKYDRDITGIWQEYDRDMTEIWQGYDRSMTEIWQEYDKDMTETWQKYDRSMTGIWQKYDKDMGKQLVPQGSSQPPVHELGCRKDVHNFENTFRLRRNMTEIWQRYDRNMTGVWQRYDRDMTETVIRIWLENQEQYRTMTEMLLESWSALLSLSLPSESLWWPSRWKDFFSNDGGIGGWWPGVALPCTYHPS